MTGREEWNPDMEEWRARYTNPNSSVTRVTASCLAQLGHGSVLQRWSIDRHTGNLWWEGDGGRVAESPKSEEEVTVVEEHCGEGEISGF